MSESLPSYRAPDYNKLPPRLNPKSLAPSEQEACSELNAYLAELTGYVNDFGAALELYEFSTNSGHGHQPRTRAGFSFATPEEIRIENQMRRWRIIAAKDGAMTIYNFGEMIDLIRGGLKDCQSLRKLVDTKKLKDVDKQFDVAFPNYARLRHSVAHQNLVVKKPFAALRQSNNGGRVIFTGMLSGRKFISVWNGTRVEYQLSEHSLRQLADLRDETFSAFAEATVVLQKHSKSHS